MTQRLYEGTLVEVKNLKRSFGSGKTQVDVLCGVDLQVEAGELVVLFGPSGSGKTTLLNLIGALDQPNEGSVSIQGQDIIRMSEGKRAKLRRRGFGFIFQTYTLMPTYTAAENIDLVLRLPGLNIFERRRRVKSALEAVGLSAWADHLPGQLSGGQKQRVAIARALALRPAIILADEPTSGLDTRTSRRVLSLLKGIGEAQGTAFLIVSHDATVQEYVHRAFDLRDGKLIPRQMTPA
jgi:putative ABC transport system ATP-binding protein